MTYLSLLQHGEKWQTCSRASMEIAPCVYRCSNTEERRRKGSTAWLGHGVSPRVCVLDTSVVISPRVCVMVLALGFVSLILVW